MKTYNSIILTVVFSLIFVFCSCESEDSDSDNLQTQQENIENILIGDWSYKYGDERVYRFINDGTVFIGKYIIASQSNNPYTENTLKFFYKSNWEIIDNKLIISGEYGYTLDLIEKSNFHPGIASDPHTESYLNSFEDDVIFLIFNNLVYDIGTANHGNDAFKKKDYSNVPVVDISDLEFRHPTFNGKWLYGGSNGTPFNWHNGQALKDDGDFLFETVNNLGIRASFFKINNHTNKREGQDMLSHDAYSIYGDFHATYNYYVDDWDENFIYCKNYGNTPNLYLIRQ